MVDEPREPDRSPDIDGPSGRNAGDETTALPSGDRAGDETTALPDVGQTAQQPISSAPWSGRAEVPVGAPGAAAEQDWAEEQPEGRWWMPIVIGVVALLLLGLAALAVWLFTNADEPGGPVVPSPSPTVTSTPGASPSAAPTTSAPSPNGTTESPTAVPLPPLVGLSQEAARALLDQLGVAYRLEFRTSDQPAGTVIDTDPQAGEPVTRDEQVTLVIAEAPDTPEPVPPTTRSAPPPTDPTVPPPA